MQTHTGQKMIFSVFLCSFYLSTEFALFVQDEQNILEQFRERIKGKVTKPYMMSDTYLTRWLKTTEYNLKDAEEMFTENLEWRRENDVDNLPQADYSDLEQDYVYRTDTHDKQGRPVLHVNYGQWDVRAAAVQGKLRRLSLYACRIFEIMEHRVTKARESGWNITSTITILDLDGLNTVQHLCTSCVTLFIQITDCIESHYPFLTDELIYINAPGKFQTLVTAASAILRESTVKTLRFFDDKSKWMPYLDERIARDQRYRNAGGTKELL